MAMPRESYLIPTSVPTRASSTATQPLAQPFMRLQARQGYSAPKQEKNKK
jgi:hypothetical protein